ncbi:hypothetical protein NKH18_04680 [Streptomyces sp. M10(2022)]
MSPSRSRSPHSPRAPHSPRPARSASVLNEKIRALWQRSGGLLSPDDEAEYQRLLVEWAAAAGTGVSPAV